jgi:putative flippase GtrA
VSPLVGRWIRFNFVGLVGVGVQLGVLALLKSGLGLGYMAATALAVETAVLHNFVWHERFTWKDRRQGGTRAAALRLLRFHLGNGLISILGNLALMRVLAGWLRWHYLLANAATIAICSLANFLVSERYVFRATASEERPGDR